LTPWTVRKNKQTREDTDTARAQKSCKAQASKTKLAFNYPDIKQMDKKGKHALLSESALHKSLACKN
jgi:hypothetical protein